MADPKIAALMAANMQKQRAKQHKETVFEASGEVQRGEQPKFKKKPPPKAQQIGMQAMLLHEATTKGVKLKKTPRPPPP